VIMVDSDDSHDDAVEHVQGEPAKRRRQDSEDADATLARKLQADELRRQESDEALARRLQEEEVMGKRGGGGGGSAGGPGRSLKRSRAGVWTHDQAQPHPVFKADGLGFWLLHTEGIEKEANSPEYVVRLRDVVVGDIKWAVLSNYLYDMEWLLEEIPKLRDIPCVSILYHGQDNAVPLQFRKLPPNFRAFAPPLPDRYGTHHSKFVLLGYETGIRVVVITCNHIRQDHYDMTDALWAQDFPLKASSSPGEGGSSSKWGGHTYTANRAAPTADMCEPQSEFEECLVLYLAMARWKGAEAGGQRVDLRTLGKFDYSAARARLIASVPGRHAKEEGDLWRWGQMALRRALRTEVFDAHLQGANLVCQFTSIGGLKGKIGQRFLQSLLVSLNSGSGHNTAPKSNGGTYFVWPTTEEVRTSTKGYVMGSSIPGRLQNVWQGDAKALLQPLYSRYSSGSRDIDKDPWGRGRAMPHIKTFLRHVGKDIAWLFLSSFNLSGAAWGKLERNENQLHIMSYELGVLLLPSLLPSGHLACGPAFSCTDSALPATTTLPATAPPAIATSAPAISSASSSAAAVAASAAAGSETHGVKMRMVAGNWKVPAGFRVQGFGFGFSVKGYASTSRPLVLV
jgi:tyrosyl-DNA phosphodiesterase 1